jgi:hypothetical protein
MCHLGQALARQGWLLRTGGAEGADEAFVLGSETDLIDLKGPGGDVQIFLPWATFQGWRERGKTEGRVFEDPTPEAFEMAAEYHPAWNFLKQGARKLHARNMHIMLGWELDDPVDLVICWTPEAKVTGGTGQALRVADDLDIKVWNLANPEHRDVISNALEQDRYDSLRE